MYNKIFILYLFIIPEQFSNIKELIEVTNKPVNIYNYYLYYNIDKDNKQQNLRTKSIIGMAVIDSNKKIKLKLDDEFKKNLQRYIDIEELIKENNLTNIVPRTDIEIIKWSENIRQLEKQGINLDDLDTKTKQEDWQCYICNDKPKYSRDVLLCPKCNIGTQEMFDVSERTSKEISKPKDKIRKIKVSRRPFKRK